MISLQTSFIDEANADGLMGMGVGQKKMKYYPMGNILQISGMLCCETLDVDHTLEQYLPHRRSRLVV